MAEQEYGICECCYKEAPLTRTYFYYNLPCECCGCTIDGKHYHSEMVSHCKDCVPDIPERLHVSMRCEMDNKEYIVEIFGMKPDKIKGEYCIK